MTRPEAVVFDIGNVLVEWQPERFYDRVIGVEARRKLFATVDLHAMNDTVDRGGPFRETIYATADQHPEWRDEIRLWHDRWIEIAAPVIPLSLHLLRLLGDKAVPVFALTNFGIESFTLAEKHYDWLGRFDRRYISGHMGVIKPDERIFEMVERDCGIPADRLLFADDRRDNIATAQGRGWQTHHFITPEGWADRLVEAGLITQTEARI